MNQNENRIDDKDLILSLFIYLHITQTIIIYNLISINTIFLYINFYIYIYVINHEIKVNIRYKAKLINKYKYNKSNNFDYIKNDN